MKKFLSIALALCAVNSWAVGPAVVPTRPMRYGGCVLPPVSQLEVPTSSAYTSGNAGTNGFISYNPAYQTTGADVPTYGATSGPNSQPGLTFNGSSDFLNFLNPINAHSPMTQLIIFKTANTGTQSFTSGVSGALAWFLVSQKQTLHTASVATLWTGTDTYSTATWYAILQTYNPTTGVYAAWQLNTGTANSDGSGTGSTANPNAITFLGESNGASFFNGVIALHLLYKGTYSATNATTAAQFTYCLGNF
jgi:hypothetical protein